MQDTGGADASNPLRASPSRATPRLLRPCWALDMGIASQPAAALRCAVALLPPANYTVLLDMSAPHGGARFAALARSEDARVAVRLELQAS